MPTSTPPIQLDGIAGLVARGIKSRPAMVYVTSKRKDSIVVGKHACVLD